MSNKDRYPEFEDRRWASWRKKPTHDILMRIYKGWIGSRRIVDEVLAERGFDPHNLPAEGELKTLTWFKLNVSPLLTAYDIKYIETETGDLGDLKQVNFESDTIGGNVDFWDIGWLGIFVWDYTTEKELLNVLIEPRYIDRQPEALRQLFALLSIEVPG